VFYGNQSGWFLAWELPLTYPTLSFKEIQVPSKRMALPSETLFQTLDLENFATACRSSKRGTTKVDAQSVINWTVVDQLS